MIRKSLTTLIFGTSLLFSNLVNANLPSEDRNYFNPTYIPSFEVNNFENTETNHFLNFLKSVILVEGKVDENNKYQTYMPVGRDEYFFDYHSKSIGIIVEGGKLGCVYDQVGDKYVLVESISDDDDVSKQYCRNWLSHLRNKLSSERIYNPQ